jgi:meso-butanediol dehydrogenase/(S,S)-butanediol dehydrogenase/diacetyl reductase
MSHIKGQRVFITGAGGGMGRGIAATFARRGAILGLADRDQAGLARTVAAIAGAPGTPWVRPLDVTDAGAVDAAVRAFATEAGGLDLVVNAAGILSVAKVVDMDPAEWRRVLEVNATGTFLVAQAAARVMIAAGTRGSIVNVSSMAGKVGDPTLAHYSASKFAVIGLTQSLAREVAEHGITVNAVCPGIVETPMIDHLAKAWGASVAEFLKPQLVKRAQTPEEIAQAILFLHACRSVTGQSVNVDGGTYFH